MIKHFTEGRAITEESALALFEKIVGRPATVAERAELADAWRARIAPGPPESFNTKFSSARSPRHPLHVVIEVSGGVAECTSRPNGVYVEIIDHDNNEADEDG